MFSPRQFIFTCVLSLASLVSGVAPAATAELPDLDPLRLGLLLKYRQLMEVNQKSKFQLVHNMENNSD